MLLALLLSGTVRNNERFVVEWSSLCCTSPFGHENSQTKILIAKIALNFNNFRIMILYLKWENSPEQSQKKQGFVQLLHLSSLKFQLKKAFSIWCFAEVQLWSNLWDCLLLFDVSVEPQTIPKGNWSFWISAQSSHLSHWSVPSRSACFPLTVQMMKNIEKLKSLQQQQQRNIPFSSIGNTNPFKSQSFVSGRTFRSSTVLFKKRSTVIPISILIVCRLDAIEYSNNCSGRCEADGVRGDSTMEVSGTRWSYHFLSQSLRDPSFEWGWVISCRAIVEQGWSLESCRDGMADGDAAMAALLAAASLWWRVERRQKAVGPLHWAPQWPLVNACLGARRRTEGPLEGEYSEGRRTAAVEEWAAAAAAECE